MVSIRSITNKHISAIRTCSSEWVLPTSARALTFSVRSKDRHQEELRIFNFSISLSAFPFGLVTHFPPSCIFFAFFQFDNHIFGSQLWFTEWLIGAYFFVVSVFRFEYKSKANFRIDFDRAERCRADSSNENRKTKMLTKNRKNSFVNCAIRVICVIVALSQFISLPQHASASKEGEM